MTQIKTLTTKELEKKIDQKQDFYFWNVLTEDNFKNELIPGSEWVPLDRIGRKVKEENIPGEEQIVVYCGSESCPQSTKAAEKLNDLGYSNVYDYEGGVKEWKDTGHRIEQLEKA